MSKPKTYTECMERVKNGNLEIMAVEFDGPCGDADIILLVQDNDRSYEDGKIYQLRFPDPGPEPPK